MAEVRSPVTTETDSAVVSVAKGGGFLAAGSLFDYVARFVVALVMARVLGVDDYGAYNLSVSLAFVVAGVANLGLDAAMERYLAVFTRRGDSGGVRGTLRLGVGVSLIGAIVTSAIFYLTAPSIAAATADSASVVPLFRLAALAVPILTMTTVLSAAARGFLRMDHSSFAEKVVQPLVRTVLIVGLAVVGFDARAAVVIFLGSFAAALVVLVRLISQRVAAEPGPAVVRPHVKEIAAFSFPFWLAGMLTQVRKNVQPVLLGVFNNLASVGIFSVASSAQLVGHAVYLSISKSLRPILAGVLDAGDHAAAQRLYRTTTRWTILTNLPLFVMTVLYPSVILSVFGESFTAGASALVILAFGELASVGTGTCGTVIDMSGYNRVKVINKFVWVGLSLGLNVVLIPRYGIIGAASAAVGATASIQFIRVIEVWRLAGLTPWDRLTLKPLTAGAVAFATGLAAKAWLPIAMGVPHLVVAGILVGSVYVAVLGLLGLADDDRMVLGLILGRARKAVSR